jgi:predicted HTH transcriptional regulator
LKTDLQRKLSGEFSNIYPPVNTTVLVREKDGKKFLAVIVYGSSNNPHFAGKSYVRDGTQTVEASEAQFEELIARRSSKVAEILKWKDKEITYYTPTMTQMDAVSNTGTKKTKRILHDCNQYWLTIREPGESQRLTSVSLRQIELNYDHAKDRLMLESYPS